MAGSVSITQVIIDSIDVNTLANNVITHLVKKNENVNENMVKKAGGMVLEEQDEETDGTSAAMPPPSPYEYQTAPSTEETSYPVATTDSVTDTVDYPGYGHTVGGTKKNKIQLLTRVMLQVADELDQKEELWQLFSSLELTKETAYDTFCDIAMGLFRNGISWGKIVVLFAFAAHCVIKAVLSEVPNILVMLSSFVARFAGDWLRQWIEDNGGWDALTSPAKHPMLVIGGAVVVGILGGVLIKVIMDRMS